MKISVIMATYNGMRYIREQLDSVKNQSRAVDEVIIIDDCSKDDTYNFIDRYIREHELDSWKLYRNEKNLGYIGNFKKGLSLSGGDIIFTCDQDDVWDANKVNDMAAVLQAQENILLLASSLEFIDSEGNQINKEYIPYGLNNAPEGSVNYISYMQVLEKNFFPGCTMAIRRCVAERYCVSEESEISHDWVMAMLAAEKHGLAWYNVKLTKYRIHSSNTLGLAAANSSRLKYIKQTISTWKGYCLSLWDRLVYTENYIKLDEAEADIFKQLKKFYAYRTSVVLHKDLIKNKERLSLMGRLKYYILELKEYFSKAKRYVDIRGLAIDFIYIIKS